MNAHFHALEALLFPGHDAAPTAEEQAQIDHHGRALLADPRLEQVDFATGAERWFAETLAASIPAPIRCSNRRPPRSAGSTAATITPCRRTPMPSSNASPRPGSRRW
ncbi:hypothetical protein ACVOMT_05520 [Sphingomonas panni]